MKQVTKEEFFGIIKERKLDVNPRIINSNHPYNHDWVFRNGGLFGTDRVQTTKIYPFYERLYYIN